MLIRESFNTMPGQYSNNCSPKDAYVNSAKSFSIKEKNKTNIEGRKAYFINIRIRNTWISFQTQLSIWPGFSNRPPYNLSGDLQITLDMT